MSFTNIWMAVRPTRISEPKTRTAKPMAIRAAEFPYAIDPNGEYNKIPVQLNSLEHPLHPARICIWTRPPTPFVVFKSTATNIGALGYDAGTEHLVFPDASKLGL